MTTTRRTLLAAASLAPLGAAARQRRAAAQPAAFPDRPVRYIVPFPPAGLTDIMARIVGQKLAETWGKPVVIDNRPGGNALLGPDIAALAKKDPLLRETIVYLTCVHELGHAMGLAHTSDYRDIMYFFGYGGDIPGFFNRYRAQLTRRDDIRTQSGLSTRDIERVAALYRH